MEPGQPFHFLVLIVNILPVHGIFANKTHIHGGGGHGHTVTVSIFKSSSLQSHTKKQNMNRIKHDFRLKQYFLNMSIIAVNFIMYDKWAQ